MEQCRTWAQTGGRGTQQEEPGGAGDRRLTTRQQHALAAGRENHTEGRVKHSRASWVEEVMLSLYLLVVQPHLKYCVQIWAPQYEKDVKVLERCWALLSGDQWHRDQAGQGYFFPIKVVKGWSRLPSEVVGAPCLGHLDTALRPSVTFGESQSGQAVGSDNL